ncbi:hypothetical protein [Streptomyces sp. NPDC055140]
MPHTDQAPDTTTQHGPRTVILKVEDSGRFVSAYATRPNLAHTITPGARFYEVLISDTFIGSDKVPGREIANFAILGEVYADDDPEGWRNGVEVIRDLSNHSKPGWAVLRRIEAELIRAGHYSARIEAPLTQILGVTYDHPEGEPVTIVPMPEGWQLVTEHPAMVNMVLGAVVASLDATPKEIAAAFMRAADARFTW